MSNRVVGPAGGEILMSGSIREAYEHGKGPITVRERPLLRGQKRQRTAPLKQAAALRPSKARPERRSAFLRLSRLGAAAVRRAGPQLWTAIFLICAVAPLRFRWQQCTKLQRAYLPLQPFLYIGIHVGELRASGLV